METDFLPTLNNTAISHAPSIEEVGEDILVTFFAGSGEHQEDVCIYLQRYSDKGWGDAEIIATGEGEWGKSSCWNPVLFTTKNCELLLFYKVGPDPDEWWGMLKRSNDNGYTWSKGERLPNGILGPTKNKPLELNDGTLIIPSSDEKGKRWSIHLERLSASGEWSRTESINSPDKVLTIQPALLHYSESDIQLLARTASSKILQSRSNDAGVTWSEPELTKLPNPNSAIDGIVLEDGRALVVYNHSKNDEEAKVLAGPRTPLCLAVSENRGESFQRVITLEDGEGEFSYPSVIQCSDGRIQVVYTYNRKHIKRVTLNPSEIS